VFPVVVNECATGSAGFIELLNRGTKAADLGADPAWCWLVDDSDGGAQPKALTDRNVYHAAGSTTCATYKRGAQCGIVAPGERVWVKYPSVNASSADACRVLAAPRAGQTCGTPVTDVAAGGPTASSQAGQCFGRQPDGGAWAIGSLASCTQGASNGGCSVGGACDDGNPCTRGEAFSATCACKGGVADDTLSCGAGKACVSGGCISAASPAPVIVRQGSAGLLLAGTIVTPDRVFEGEVLVSGDTIQCVAASCAGEPLAASATVVRTNGVIFPGLIDTHNHIQFDIFDESDWSPLADDDFTNHNQWPTRARYKAMVDAKQYLNGEAGSPVSVGCELLKYGELKGLIAGTTSILGGAIPTNKACYGTLARTIDQSPNGLLDDKVQGATIFPTRATDADSVCKNVADGKTDAYLIHIAEGVDPIARREFDKLVDVTTVDGCLLHPKTAIVHGTALGEPELDKMAAHGMGLVWSPRSNVFLYGHGTDLTKTANIPAALERGLTVALAPDWSIGGSQNLLDELRFADKVDNTQWGDVITPQRLVEMATANPARLLGLGSVLGRVAPGYKADLLVIAGNRAQPYDALLGATPRSVRLVLVGGAALYGDDALAPLGNKTPACENLSVCGTSKFVCVAAPGATATNGFGQTYAQIRQTLVTELQKYDDKNVSEWDFSPIADLYRCP
jgi:cytosine/adenosine deaminase-related metal-dependent hydrolase